MSTKISGQADRRPRGRPRTLDTEGVLETAVQAYWQGEPLDVSVNAICRLAGVSKPSLYREFDSEDGLRCAALERYADRVLGEVLAIIGAGQPLVGTLAALTQFACADPRMETGCLFQKMRAGRPRLGPRARARVDALEAAMLTALAGYLHARRDAGELDAGLDVDTAAHYVAEQLGLAVSLRASGVDARRVRDMLTLALSVLLRPGD